MQSLSADLSLSGIRAFEAAARLRSFKAAAEELGVTASAVSHQIRQLEEAVSVKLFVRRHNSVELTAEGLRFFRDVNPAVKAIVNARRALQNSSSDIVVSASTSLALRWLIPRLGDFRKSHPGLPIRMETTSLPARLAPGVDLAVVYARHDQRPADAARLLTDRSILVYSPLLLKRQTLSWREHLSSLPILSAVSGDADWRFYCQATKFDFERLRITDRFDIDSAALEACISGLGVFLAPPAYIERELEKGSLMRLVDSPVVEFGSYWLVSARPTSRNAQLFIKWLRKQASATAQ